ncbi:hypothetical protein Tco_0134925 [Tanacetum coccineum]
MSFTVVLLLNLKPFTQLLKGFAFYRCAPLSRDNDSWEPYLPYEWSHHETVISLPLFLDQRLCLYPWWKQINGHNFEALAPLLAGVKDQGCEADMESHLSTSVFALH